MSAHIRHGDVRRGSTIALHAGELELPARANVGVVGVNGAGKSTLMHGLAGCLAGRHGPRVEALPGPVAYVPQQPALPPWLTTERAVALFGFELGALERELPELILEELRGRTAGSLSVGQRQALCVAIALAGTAPLVMLDEPFAAIDFRRRVGLLSVLRRREGSALTLVSSQNGADLLETCSWIVVLREGRYVFSGPRDELAGGADDRAAALARFEENVMGLLGARPPARA